MKIKIDAILWKDLIFLKKGIKILIVSLAMMIGMTCFIGIFNPSLEVLLPFVSLIFTTMIFGGICENTRDMMSGFLEAIASTHLSLKKVYFKDILFSAIIGLILSIFTLLVSIIILKTFGCEAEFSNLGSVLILSLFTSIGGLGIQREGGISLPFSNSFFNNLLGFVILPFYLFSFLIFFIDWAYTVLWIMSIIGVVIFLILSFFGRENKEAVINLWGA